MPSEASGAFNLEAMGTNGVLVNGVKVKSAELKPGDVVVLGGVSPQTAIGTKVESHVSDLVYVVQGAEDADDDDTAEIHPAKRLKDSIVLDGERAERQRRRQYENDDEQPRKRKVVQHQRRDEAEAKPVAVAAAAAATSAAPAVSQASNTSADLQDSRLQPSSSQQAKPSRVPSRIVTDRMPAVNPAAPTSSATEPASVSLSAAASLPHSARGAPEVITVADTRPRMRAVRRMERSVVVIDDEDEDAAEDGAVQMQESKTEARRQEEQPAGKTAESATTAKANEEETVCSKASTVADQPASVALATAPASTGEAPATKNISELEEHLKCTVCIGLLACPVSLGCGHQFCRVCIGSCFDSQPCVSVGLTLLFFPNSARVLHPPSHYPDPSTQTYLQNMSELPCAGGAADGTVVCAGEYS